MNVFFNLKKAHFSNFSKGKEKNIHADLCVPVYFSLLHTAHTPVNVTDAVGVPAATMTECAEGGADHY